MIARLIFTPIPNSAPNLLVCRQTVPHGYGTNPLPQTAVPQNHRSQNGYGFRVQHQSHPHRRISCACSAGGRETKTAAARMLALARLMAQSAHPCGARRGGSDAGARRWRCVVAFMGRFAVRCVL